MVRPMRVRIAGGLLAVSRRDYTCRLPVLDCGEAISVEMRDGEVLSASSDTIVGYTRSDVGGAPETRPWR